jgi:hypothetical protein
MTNKHKKVQVDLSMGGDMVGLESGIRVLCGLGGTK